jgi:hypothetical protein
LNTWADSRRAEVIAALRRARQGKWADGIAGTWSKQCDRLYATYFCHGCFSFDIHTGRPNPLDGRRASVVFHLSYVLHCYLTGYLIGLPGAKVLNAERRTDAAAFARAHKQVYLDSLASILKTVEHDLDVFSRVVEQSVDASGPGLASVRSSCWPYDYETKSEDVLLGLLLTDSPASINSGSLASPVAGASVVRGHLESVLFRRDFLASVHNAKVPNCDKWDKALVVLKKAGLLLKEEVGWATNTYELLSRVHHYGALLTTGEVFMLSHLTRALQDRIDSRSRKGGAE